MTATDPSASLRTSSRAARDVKFSPEARISTAKATRLPTSPMIPNTSSGPAWISAGTNRRWIADTMTNTPTASRIAAWAVAPSTSARWNPHVRCEVGERRASRVATSPMPMPPVSTTMCPASTSSASDPVTTAPTTSASRIVAEMQNATSSARSFAPACPCAWSCPMPAIVGTATDDVPGSQA